MTHTDVPGGIVTFAEGVPGFETFRRFVLLAPRESRPFAVVRSFDAGGPSFVTIDPRAVMPDYRLELDPADLVRLGAADTDTLLWLAVVMVRQDGSATANLRAPIVINPATLQGIQVVAAESAHRIEHPLQAA